MAIGSVQFSFMRILVADKFEKSGLDGLKALGAEVLSEPDLLDESLSARIREVGPEVLVVRSTKVTSDMLQDSSIKLVIRAGAGYNTIDVASASRNGIGVANTPGKNSKAVAELILGLILAIDRRIPDNVQSLREGYWNKKEFSKAQGLAGRTLGIIGMGYIGKEVAIRAKAFEMNVVCHSASLSDEEAVNLGVSKAHSLEDLASGSDIISVNWALTPHTKGSLSDAFFGAMKTGAVFINASRAEVVDQRALENAIATKRIWAGLDVFDGEPAGGTAEYGGSLRTNDNVYCTHHIGASTEQAQEAVAAEVVHIVDQFIKTGKAPNLVNP